MPLDRHAKRLLDMISAGRGELAADISAESLRRSMIQFADAADARNVPIGRVEDREIDGPAGCIPIRIFTPADAGAEPLPCILYFHGGAGVFCGIDTHDGVCRMLANSSGGRVVSVGYRLAPEHRFPAGVEDGAFVTRWVAEHAWELCVDSRRLVLAGDSAGATIVAAICQSAAHGCGPRAVLQVLLCPVTDLGAESASRREFADGYFIERSTLDWATSAYCSAEERFDPRVSPLRAATFSGLPPAHIHTAEFDPMRDEGRAYAEALMAEGVQVQYTCHSGLIHHFYCMAGAIPRARAVVSSIGAEIRATLGVPA